MCGGVVCQYCPSSRTSKKVSPILLISPKCGSLALAQLPCIHECSKANLHARTSLRMTRGGLTFKRNNGSHWWNFSISSLLSTHTMPPKVAKSEANYTKTLLCHMSFIKWENQGKREIDQNFPRLSKLGLILRTCQTAHVWVTLRRNYVEVGQMQRRTRGWNPLI